MIDTFAEMQVFKDAELESPFAREPECLSITVASTTSVPDTYGYEDKKHETCCNQGKQNPGGTP